MELMLILGVALVVLAAIGIRVVSQQTILVVETFGKFSRVLTPGLNYIFAPLQTIAGTVSLKIDSIKAVVEVKTSDNMFVQLPVDLMIQVDEKNAKDAFYRLQNPHDQIRAWVLNTVRSTAAGMSLEQMFRDKDIIVDSVRAALATKLGEFGYRIENVLVDQPAVSQEVQESFNRVVSAKREMEAAEQEGEAVKIRMIKQAEAESEAQQRRAEGLSESRKILARGLKESLGQFEGVPVEEAIKVLLDTNRIDAIRDVGKHGNLILMDINGDATSRALLPLLAGIAKKKVADDQP
jgi:regulator of protease activity HflC (stomatin/prohibitin superfamily)